LTLYKKSCYNRLTKKKFLRRKMQGKFKLNLARAS